MQPTEQVIVTGAGSGIGREFTKLFLADGATVLAVSLLQEELDRLVAEQGGAGKGLRTLQLDLSQPAAAEQLLAHCERNGFEPDVLVNNAGFACFGDAMDLDLARVESMLNLNMLTLTKLSTLFGRRMKNRGTGRILNVGSTAGMVPSPRLAAYCATKSYVNTFSFALARELAPYGVKVTCLTPGAVGTNFAHAARIDSFQGKSILKDMFDKGRAATPQAVAAAGYRGLRGSRVHVLAGKGATLAVWISRIVPQSLLPGLLKNS